MRAAGTVLLTFVLALSATAAPPELTLGAEQSVAGRFLGAAGAANAHGALIAWSSGGSGTIALLSDLEHQVTLPRWSKDSWNDNPAAVAASPAGWLVVWNETTYMTASYVAVRVAPDLTIVDETPILLRTFNRAAMTPKPAVAWNGTGWLVATDSTLTRLSDDGVIREQITTSTRTSVAAAHDAALAVSIEQRNFKTCSFFPPLCTPDTFFLAGRLIGGPGAIAPTQPLSTAAGTRGILAAGATGDGFLVLALNGSTDRLSAIGATPVTTSGVALPEILLEAPGDHTLSSAAVVSDGSTQFLAAWTGAAADGSRLRLAVLDRQGHPLLNAVTIGGTNEAGGPPALVRLTPHHFVLIYPKLTGVSAPNLVLRHIQLGHDTRGRAVRH